MNASRVENRTSRRVKAGTDADGGASVLKLAPEQRLLSCRGRGPSRPGVVSGEHCCYLCISRAGNLPFPFSLMAPIFARFPVVKAGISRWRWDALLRKAKYRVSLPVGRISLPANTISFARRCARKHGCLAQMSLSLATERSGCRASSLAQHASPSRIFSTGFIYRCGCGTLGRPGRAPGICKIWMSICETSRSMCPGSASPLERICPRGKRSRKVDARPIGSASRISRRPSKIRRLYELINNLGTYLGQNAASIVNYCRRYWSGQPIIQFAG